MGKVRGRVLVLETGAPVVNVVVAAFDLDAASDSATLNLRAASRLGSAATDGQGGFTIEFPDRDVIDGGEREARPDLLVAVFPPDIAGTSETTEAAPLYRSPRPRPDAGREESFVILLPDRLLRERGVPLFGARSISDPDELRASLATSLRQRARSAGVVREVLRPEAEQRTAVRRKTRQQLLRLMGGQPHRGARPDRFVPAGSDGQDVVAEARQSGVERLASFAPRGMRVRLTKDLIDSLGLEVDAQGNLAHEHTISQAQFEEMLGPYLATPVRVFDPLLACRITHQSESVTDASGSSSSGSPTPVPSAEGNGSSPPPAPLPPEQLHAEILKEVEALLSPADGTADAMRPNADLIAKNLALELASAPADGPALHDFHHLQIAWSNVWTAVVDERLATQMAKLYQTVVELVDWGEAHPDLSEVTELDDFLRMLEESLEVSAGIYGDAGEGTSMVAAEEMVHQGKSLIETGKDLLGLGGKDLGPDLVNQGKEVVGTGVDLVEGGVNVIKSFTPSLPSLW
jgi:hypothetical protein